MTTLQDINHHRERTAIFFDTETTGLPVEGGELHEQPCCVQLAWVLAVIPQHDEGYRELASFHSIIRLPEGRRIEDGAEKVHGISMSTANAYGMHFGNAWEAFANAADMASVRVAHSIDFDDRQLKFDWDRLSGDHPINGFSMLSKSTRLCTMELSKSVCQLPPNQKMIASGRTGFKRPRLTEAFSHLTGETMPNAHDAMADVRGCMRVLLELMNI